MHGPGKYRNLPALCILPRSARRSSTASLTAAATCIFSTASKPNETALVVIDMQPTFVAPGSPAEVPASRGIVANVQRLADVLRPRGALICWVTHANSQTAGSDWNGFFDYFVADDVRAKTLASLKAR